jgi:hypothetical protein
MNNLPDFLCVTARSLLLHRHEAITITQKVAGVRFRCLHVGMA